MKEIGLIYQTHMIQAMLSGDKKETRRAKGLKEINEDPESYQFAGMVRNINKKWQLTAVFHHKESKEFIHIPSPYGDDGDLLYARETYQHTGNMLNINPEDENYGYVYKADGQPWEDYEGWKWLPGIFMKKEAARVWKTNIDFPTIERLHDITAEGIRREGFSSRKEFRQTIVKINGPDAWLKNWYVWVIKFAVLSTSGKPDIEPATSNQQPETDQKGVQS